MIRIAIADDQELIRSGIRTILDAEADMTVVGEAADGQEAVALVRELHPDVVLLDVQMPETDGLAAAEEILADEPGCKVLMLTTFDLDEYVQEALGIGATGFLVKDMPAEDIAVAVRQAARGVDALLAPTVRRRLIDRFTRATPKSVPDQARVEELTAREIDVWELIARGLSNTEIADELVIGETTVKTHVAHILMKLGLRDRVQAVVLAHDLELFDHGPT